MKLLMGVEELEPLQAGTQTPKCHPFTLAGQKTNFPQRIVLIPHVMNSLTQCNNQPTLNHQGFWALLK